MREWNAVSVKSLYPTLIEANFSGGFVLKLLRDGGISVEEWESTR